MRGPRPAASGKGSSASVRPGELVGQAVVLVPLVLMTFFSPNIQHLASSIGSIDFEPGISSVPAFESGRNGIRVAGLRDRQVEGLGLGCAAVGHDALE